MAINVENKITSPFQADSTGLISLGNFPFYVDQSVGAGQDNYVLTYDDGAGYLSLEASAGGGGGLWTDDGGGKISYSASAAAAEVYETGFGNTYGSSVTLRRGVFMVGESITIGDNATSTTVGRTAAFGGNHTIGAIGTVDYAFSAGYNNTIEEGLYNIALGGTNTIKDTSDNAITIGTSNTITGSNTIIVGNANESKSDSAIIFGDTVTAGESSKKQLAFGNNFDVAKTYFSKGFYVEFGSGGSSRPTFGLVRATGLADTEPLNLCMGSNQSVRNDGLGGASTNAGSGVLWQMEGTTKPSTNFTNGVAHYTTSRAAGKAGYEIRTEDGTQHYLGDYSAIGGDNTVANANTILTIQGEGTSTGYGIEVEDSGGTQNLGVRDDGVIIMPNLPTSSAGLPTGALWNNSGVINIV